MLVEEALLNEQETLFRFIFAIYLWKNEKNYHFCVSNCWLTVICLVSKLNLCDTVVNSWVYCAEYAKNIVLKENYLVIQETEFSRHLHKSIP